MALAETRPTERQTAHQFVHGVLRRAILNGELPGGTRLVQADIAKQLNVSTTPVREALRDLTTEGLVEFDAHRGGIVHEPDLAELDEIIELRGVLEPVSARRAVERIDEATLARAREIHEAMVIEDDLTAWIDLNRRFHRLHHAAAGSPRLLAMIAGLQDATAVYLSRAARYHSEIRERGQQDHLAILDALERRDGERLAGLLLRHIQLPRELGADRIALRETPVS